VHDVAAAVAVWLVAAFLVQLVLVLGYRAATRRREAMAVPARLPRFGVVMPVRGLEPGLAEALRSVLAQDYPSFELHVVVDSRDDPAWPVAARTVDSSRNARIHALDARRPRCSLVCSSLLQALEALHPSCELIAFAAADLVAPRDWLRQLASGMQDETVGGTLGNRWYVPVEGRWGSLVRQQWNAGAAVLMRLLEIPWAGGLALRLRDVDTLGLRAVWERSLVEDVSVVRSLRAAGRHFRFLPGLLVANRDEIDLPAAYRFIARQLLWTRLHHPAWSLILAHALAGSATLLGPLAVAVLAAARGDGSAAALAVGSLAAYLVAMLSLLAPMEAAVRSRLRESGQEPLRWTARLVFRSLIVVPLSQLVFTLAALRAAFARSVTWSGVTYAVNGPLEARLVSDARRPSAGASAAEPA
jgi:hypothetical protein